MENSKKFNIGGLCVSITCDDAQPTGRLDVVCHPQNDDEKLTKKDERPGRIATAIQAILKKHGIAVNAPENDLLEGGKRYFSIAAAGNKHNAALMFQCLDPLLGAMSEEFPTQELFTKSRFEDWKKKILEYSNIPRKIPVDVKTIFPTTVRVITGGGVIEYELIHRIGQAEVIIAINSKNACITVNIKPGETPIGTDDADRLQNIIDQSLVKNGIKSALYEEGNTNTLSRILLPDPDDQTTSNELAGRAFRCIKELFKDMPVFDKPRYPGARLEQFKEAMEMLEQNLEEMPDAENAWEIGAAAPLEKDIGLNDRQRRQLYHAINTKLPDGDKMPLRENVTKSGMIEAVINVLDEAEQGTGSLAGIEDTVRNHLKTDEGVKKAVNVIYSQIMEAIAAVMPKYRQQPGAGMSAGM